MKWRLPLFAFSVALFPAGALADTPASISVGEVLRHQISRSDIHQYQIYLTDQPTQIATEPSYFDVALVVRRPDGSRVLRTNSPPMEIDDESLVFIPPVAGDYIIEIEGVSEYRESGEYALSVTLPNYTQEHLAAALASTEAAGIELDSPLLDPEEAVVGALALYTKSAEHWGNTDESQLQARSLAYAGWLAFELGDLDKAEASFSQALSLGQGTRRQDAWNRAYLGSVALDRDQMDLAQTQYMRALDLARQVKDDFGAAAFLNYLGLVDQYRNFPRAAAKWYEQTLATLERIEFPHQEATTLNNIGGTHYQMGNFDEALIYYQRALDIQNRINDVDEQATVLGNMASLYRDQGDLTVSLDYNLRTLELYRLLDDRRGINLVYYRLGILFHRMGDYERAESYYLRAYERQEEIGSFRRAANALRDLGVLYAETGETEKALTVRARALEIYSDINSTVNIARARVALAGSFIQSERFDDAQPMLSDALSVLLDVELMPEVADALMQIGAYHVGVGDLDSARKSFDEALEIHRAVSDPIGQIDLLTASAAIESDAELALEKLDQAEIIARSIRQEVANPALKARFSATLQALYDSIVRANLALSFENSDDEFLYRSFMASERNRARSLLELVTAAELTPSALRADLLEEHKEVQRQLNALLVSVTRLRTDIANPEIEELVADSDAEITDLKTRLDYSANLLTREYLPESGSEPVTYDQIRAALGHRDVLLHMHLGEAEGAIWRVTQGGISVRKLPARAIIDTLARETYTALSRSNTSATDRESITELTTLLLGDPASFADYQRVYVVADGFLHYVPIAALMFQSGELAESRMSFVNLPSSRFLLREPEPTIFDSETSVLVYADPIFGTTDFRAQGGDDLQADNDLVRAVSALGFERMPRLPFSATEARAISSSAPSSRIVSGFDASKQHFLGQNLRNVDVIHFATHGITNDRFPALSGLVFSLIDEDQEPQDGFLGLGEISLLSMNPSLVVLSACETGVGEALSGEGLLSLSRAFVAQGADDVIASLWQVNDRATAELMRHFYTALFDQKKPVDEALSYAQRQVSAQPEWRAPYYWAGFIATSTGRASK